MRARYAYVALAVLTLAMTAVAIVYTTSYADRTGRKFCGVVQAVTSVHVERPAHAAAHPARERQWELHQEFERLGQSLGC